MAQAGDISRFDFKCFTQINKAIKVKLNKFKILDREEG